MNDVFRMVEVAGNNKSAKDRLFDYTKNNQITHYHMKDIKNVFH